MMVLKMLLIMQDSHSVCSLACTHLSWNVLSPCIRPCFLLVDLLWSMLHHNWIKSIWSFWNGYWEHLGSQCCNCRRVKLKSVMDWRPCQRCLGFPKVSKVTLDFSTCLYSLLFLWPHLNLSLQIWDLNIWITAMWNILFDQSIPLKVDG